MKRYLLISLIGVALLVMIFGYSVLAPLRSNRFYAESRADREIPVSIVRVKKSQLQRVKQIEGELKPLEETIIVSRLPGVVREIRYKVGDRVAAGARVATLESKELLERLHTQERGIKETQDDLRAKQAGLISAEKEAANARELYRRELIARGDVEQAQGRADTARAEKDVAEAQLAQRQSLLEQTRYLLNLTQLVAPAAGVVTRRWVEPRATVAPSTKILSMAKTNTMRLSVPLPPASAADLYPGMTLRLRIEHLPGHEFEAKLARLDAASETGKTAMAEVQLSDNDGLLKTGMKAVLSLPTGATEEVILLPHEALFELGGKSYVYTATDGKAQRKAVTQGGEQDGKVVITSGLAEGESVVVTDTDRLRPDSRVRIVE